jgi:hypothetical protein
MLGDGGEDISLDLVFDSRGIVTDSGYQVELAIPFASLRFPDQPEQAWRLNFWRDRQRENRYQYSWIAQDRDNPCFICQMGTLSGIENVKPGSNLDILPNVTSFQSGALDDSSVPDSDFGSQNPDAELSLNARYSLSTNSSVELTINPDFSQVESDAGQIDVNETHALFYPERRPFFQEGSNLYRSFVNVVHTRTINDPIVAAKFTGKFGRFSMAYLAARDDNTLLMVPLRETTPAVELENSTVNVFRGRQTFGQDSYVGFVLTDRRTDSFGNGESSVSSGSGTVTGFDGRIRLNQNYRFEFLALGSHTKEISGTDLLDPNETFDNGRHTVALDGESFGGRVLVAHLNRGGRYWSFNIDYREFTPTFRPDNGIIGGNDRRAINFWTGVTFQPNREWLVQWGPRVMFGRIYSHRASFNLNPATWESGTRDEWFRPELYFNLKGQTHINLSYLASREWYRGNADSPRPFTGISRGFVNASTRPAGWIELGGNFEYGRKVVRFLAEPVMGILTNFSAYGSFKLSQRLRIYPNFSFQKMQHRDGYLAGSPDGERTIYQVEIYRARVDYQFTREWFLRLVLEYGNYNSSGSPNYLAVEPLLTYRINPFTLFYIGANWGGRHFEKGYLFEREPDIEQEWAKSTWRLQRAQVFAKFQYLFRI